MVNRVVNLLTAMKKSKKKKKIAFIFCTLLGPKVMLLKNNAPATSDNLIISLYDLNIKYVCELSNFLDFKKEGKEIQSI